MMASKIQWTDETWNPVTGCTKISAGCKNCYAERMSKRLRGRHGYPADDPFAVTLRPDRLSDPLGWKKPRMIFVNSMSDLFHKSVPFEFIAKCFDVMWSCPQHQFQVLTKRVDRMVEFVESYASALEFEWGNRINAAPMSPGSALHIEDNQLRNNCGWCYRKDDEIDSFNNCQHHDSEEGYCDAGCCPIGASVDDKKELLDLGYSEGDYLWDGIDDDGNRYTTEPDIIRLHTRPLDAFCSNVYLGAIAENQKLFNERIADMGRLRNIVPHATLFLSVEPLLGPINISKALEWVGFTPLAGSDAPSRKRVVDWIIIGPETGPGARECKLEWQESLTAQCIAAGVPVFNKAISIDGEIIKKTDDPRWPDWAVRQTPNRKDD